MNLLKEESEFSPKNRKMTLKNQEDIYSTPLNKGRFTDKKRLFKLQNTPLVKECQKKKKKTKDFQSEIGKKHFFLETKKNLRPINNTTKRIFSTTKKEKLENVNIEYKQNLQILETKTNKISKNLISKFEKLLIESETKKTNEYLNLENEIEFPLFNFHEIDIIKKFFKYFKEKNSEIINLFTKNAILEIKNEVVYSLCITLKILSNNFETIDLNNQEIIIENNELYDNLIINGKGKGKARQTNFTIEFLFCACVTNKMNGCLIEKLIFDFIF